jgi:hypothetical protein
VPVTVIVTVAVLILPSISEVALYVKLTVVLAPSAR